MEMAYQLWENRGDPGALVTPHPGLTPNREGLAMKATQPQGNQPPMICPVADCEKPVRQNGLCSMHGTRMYRHGTLELPGKPACSVEGCDDRASHRTWCQRHYQVWYKTGDPLKSGLPPLPVEPMESENWRDIPGWEGLYQVSDLGRVKSLARTVPRKGGLGRVTRERLLRPADSAGYPSVNLCKDGFCKAHKMHWLVLSAFVGPRPEGFHGCHHDDNRSNNHLSNLRWDTISGNRSDQYRNNGGHPMTIKANRPEMLARVALVEDLVAQGLTRRHIVERTGLSAGQVMYTLRRIKRERSSSAVPVGSIEVINGKGT